MAKRKPFYVAHERGVAVPVYRYERTKNETAYSYFTVVDNSGPDRRLITLSDPDEAKKKADDIASAIRAGQSEMVEIDALKLDIKCSLEALEPHGMKLLPAAQLLSSALAIVNANELLSACYYWKQRPTKPITPKPAKTAVDEFLARHKVSPRRHRTNTAYLTGFKEDFAGRNVCDIQTLDIKDWANAKNWKERTRNDVLGTVSLFFKDAIERGLAVTNPASFKRKKVKSGSILIFTPIEAQRILYGVDEDVRAFLAIIFFSGCRKEEASRLTWTQLNAGLESGSIYLPSNITKTGQDRSLPVITNLAAWLKRYRKPAGLLLPERWQDSDPINQMRKLDDMGKHISRKTGVRWVKNGFRHAYGTFHLKLYCDPASTVKAMGNSLVQLQRHYSSRADTVTKEQAEAWFNIMPPGDAINVVVLDKAALGQ